MNWHRMVSLGFTAVHHSQEYTSAYRPAYRVLWWDLLREDLDQASTNKKEGEHGRIFISTQLE